MTRLREIKDFLELTSRNILGDEEMKQIEVDDGLPEELASHINGTIGLNEATAVQINKSVTDTEVPVANNQVIVDKNTSDHKEVGTPGVKNVRFSLKKNFFIFICIVLLAYAGCFAIVEYGIPLYHYQIAERDLEQGEYQAAYDAFVTLKSFKDSEQLADGAQKMLEAMKMRSEGDLLSAYKLLASISDKKFKDTVTTMKGIQDEVYERVVDCVADGGLPIALWYINYFDSIEDSRFDGLSEKLIENEHIELDHSYYNLNPLALSSFNANTSSEQYASIIANMFLSGKTRTSIAENRNSKPYSEDSSDKIIDCTLTGYDIAEDWLPEYASVYQTFGSTIYFEEDYKPSRLVLQCNKNNPFSDSELQSQIEGIENFCEESVKALNDAGLIGASMSNYQKARTIYDWVCAYMTYDDSLKIHNTYIAIKNKTGVCESYVGVYNRMCNLVGVPTFAQVGDADGVPTDNIAHIWSIQLDEDGNRFYTDPTWGDDSFCGILSESPYGILSESHLESINNVHSFCNIYSQFLNKTMIAKGNKLSSNWTKKSDFEKKLFMKRMDKPYFNSDYFWQEDLWKTHIPDRTADTIIKNYVDYAGGCMFNPAP